MLAGCFLWKRKNALKPVLQSWFWAAAGVLAFFACIGIWAAVDFNSFWVSFHHVFFTNDLWLLDPASSRMIRMFQEEFFAAMVARILVWFLAIVIGSAAAAGIVYQRMKKHGRYPVSYTHLNEIPVVFIDNLPEIDREIDSVMIDNVKASKIAMHHLLALGHKNIAVIIGSIEETTGYDLSLIHI